ncbi:ABC transporter ATP-binding protein [Tsukamurella serpentis]
MGAKSVSSGYGHVTILDELDLQIPTGVVTTIIGPNGCGKSTLLRTLARLIKPSSGQVVLDGVDIATLKSKQIATTMGLLPQSPQAPEGLTVGDLVARGRHPHQSWLRQWSSDDADVVDAALAQTGVRDLADRPVDSLSGGQRQRVWISMTLAQGTDLLLLDEPTTFLDLSHALDVLDLVDELRSQGRTIVMVLHDLNLAIRYSDHLIAMRDGAVVAQGTPSEIISEQMLSEVFGLSSTVIDDPVSPGRPCIVPIGARRTAARRSDIADR